ncbi:MAG: hypothetical protein ACRDXB_14950 [Actinomycetes bacterium]
MLIMLSRGRLRVRGAGGLISLCAVQQGLTQMFSSDVFLKREVACRTERDHPSSPGRDRVGILRCRAE